MRPQAVTIGYDFIRDMTESSLMEIGRVKVDICCHLVAPEQRIFIVPWIKQLLAGWSLNGGSLAAFIDGVHTIWEGSEIQFLSIGFASTLQHATVYVKPGA